MKIMIVTGGYLPARKYGGPVASLVNFVEQLGEFYDIDIVSTNHDLGDTTPFPNIKPGFNPLGKAQVLYISDKEKNYLFFKSLIKERKPDCLYLSSIFDFKLNFPLLLLAKQTGIKVVYAPRGELSDKVLKIKALKKHIFLFAMRVSGLYKSIYFQATSDREKKDTARRLKVPEKMIFSVANVPTSPAFKNEILKTPGSLRIVFISRIHRSKNLIYALECVNRLSGDITFDIYGHIEHSDYWQDCLKLMAIAPYNVKINYLGEIEMGKSKSVFLKYDCFLFPTLSENYSQAIAESVLSGTIPVISRGTTPWDDIDLNGGFAIPLDSPSEFVKTLQALCNMENEEYKNLYDLLLKYRKTKLDTTSLCEKYHKMFNEVIGR